MGRVYQDFPLVRRFLGWLGLLFGIAGTIYLIVTIVNGDNLILANRRFHTEEIYVNRDNNFSVYCWVVASNVLFIVMTFFYSYKALKRRDS